jgi:hypothetical protein
LITLLDIHIDHNRNASEILVLNFIHSPEIPSYIWLPWQPFMNLTSSLSIKQYQLNCLDHYTHAIDLWSIKFHVWSLRRLHIYSNKLWTMWPTRFCQNFSTILRRAKLICNTSPLLNKTLNGSLNRGVFIKLLGIFWIWYVIFQICLWNWNYSESDYAV